MTSRIRLRKRFGIWTCRLIGGPRILGDGYTAAQAFEEWKEQMEASA